MADKKWIEDFEAGALSEAEELALLRRARAQHHKQKQQVADILRNQAFAEAKQAKIMRFRRNLFFAAAASMLFGAIGWWITRTTLPPTPQQMFAQVAAPKSPDPYMMDSKPKPEKPHQVEIDAFITAYESRNYAQAIQFAAKIPSLTPELQAILGYCHLQTGNYAASIAIFKRLYEMPDVAKDNARWWLGLSYGLAQDRPNMELYLREIQPFEYEYENAQRLLKK